MQNDNFKNQLQLHFIVLIWGFTAILVALISVDAIPLVWLRVLIASITIYIFTRIKKINLRIDKSTFVKFFIGGIFIALHWASFFYAIKVSTISITLVTMSSSAIFVALLEPIISNKKFRIYELVLASVAIIGFIVIFKVEFLYAKGIIYALISSLLLAIFSIFNSKLIIKHKAIHIAFYELALAFVFLSFLLLITNSFSFSDLQLTSIEILYLFILSTVATAYPFVIATDLLKKMGPFTLVLTNNLEPVYGIILALIIFGDKEKMSSQFYIGAFIILCSVIINSVMKNKIIK
ncbi:MAG: EamA family transporter [Flavobacteriaceae bacterium]|nr:EamA family transporter [Flavobacteriaceae bacterium]